MTQVTRLAVLGSPILHSKSPALHSAAYSALGLDWSYEAIEVRSGELSALIETLDDDWRGLSLTMPLKREVLPLLSHHDEMVALSEAANTVLVTESGLHGFNTDIAGIVAAFHGAGVDLMSNVRLLGGGATAGSALIAAAELGAARAVVSVRTPAKASGLVALGERLGVVVSVETLGVFDHGFPADVVISTLPSSADTEIAFPEGLMATSVYFDVTYDPWPTPMAAAWAMSGGRIIPGIEMLVAQALVQVRIFVHRDPLRELEGEAAVLEAMRTAVGLPPVGV